MEILYKKEKEEADQLLEQQRLVSSNELAFNQTHFESVFCDHARSCRQVSNNCRVGLIDVKP